MQNKQVGGRRGVKPDGEKSQHLPKKIDGFLYCLGHFLVTFLLLDVLHLFLLWLLDVLEICFGYMIFCTIFALFT